MQELQKCFESQDIGQLKAVIASMPPAEAAKHMKRCVDSGLWVPEGGVNNTRADTGLVDRKEEDSDDEDVYEEVGETITAATKNQYEKVEDTVD